jgi:carbonic anhydrase
MVEVTSVQIEQIKNISGFDNNFRDPQPLWGRVIEDGTDDPHSWAYPYNAIEWGEVSSLCREGTSQSPIDLPNHEGFIQDELNITHGSNYNLTVSHEHSLKFALDNAETYPTLNFKGIMYSLLQMHCHTGSEHTVDGLQYPGECHFVYQSSSGAYAVIGIFLDDSAEHNNPFFSELLDNLPQTVDWVEEKLMLNVDTNSIILGLDLGIYWAYNGSFTTPGCDENVQ